MGLKLVVPTSVAGSGVSVSSSGKVTFTAATSININGCFTSTYDNYLIVIRWRGTVDVSLQYRLRLSGTDATGSNYDRQGLFVNATGISGGRVTGQTLQTLCDCSTGLMDNGAHVYFYGPALAQQTSTRSLNVYGNNGAHYADYATRHTLATAYDGLTLIPAGGNVTGALTIYGFSQ